MAEATNKKPDTTPQDTSSTRSPRRSSAKRSSCSSKIGSRSGHKDKEDKEVKERAKRSSRSMQSSKQSHRSSSRGRPSRQRSTRSGSRRSLDISDRDAKAKARGRKDGGGGTMKPGVLRVDSTNDSRSRSEKRKSQRSGSCSSTPRRESRERREARKMSKRGSSTSRSRPSREKREAQKARINEPKRQPSSRDSNPVPNALAAGTADINLNAVAVDEQGENQRIERLEKQLQEQQLSQTLMIERQVQVRLDAMQKNQGEETDDNSNEGNSIKWGRILVAICCLVLLIVGGVVAYFMMKSSDEPSTATVPPTTAMQKYEPPSVEDCSKIANGETSNSQEGLPTLTLDLGFDIEMFEEAPYSGLWLAPFMVAIREKLISRIVGCGVLPNEERRLLPWDELVLAHNGSRELAEVVSSDVSSIRFVVAGAIATGEHAVDEQCGDGAINPCYRADVRLEVFLKGVEKVLSVVKLIEEIVKESENKTNSRRLAGDKRRLALVPFFELPPDYFKKITLAGITGGGTETVSPTVSALPETTVEPSVEPSQDPSVVPSSSPSFAPVPGSSPSPTDTPTIATPSPTLSPTKSPTTEPSKAPTSAPVVGPSPPPTPAPTPGPTPGPTLAPTQAPTPGPTPPPTPGPTDQATPGPTPLPSVQPSAGPTSLPSSAPSSLPSSRPSGTPSLVASSHPSQVPSQSPTIRPVKYGEQLKIKSNYRDTYLTDLGSHYALGRPYFSYVYIFRSANNDGSLESVDPRAEECVKYGDFLAMQPGFSTASIPLHLSGARWGTNADFCNRANTHVYPADYATNSYYGMADLSFPWSIRSVPGSGSRAEADPRSDECVSYGDTVYIQVSWGDNFWLTAGTDTSDDRSYTSNYYDLSCPKANDARSYEWTVEESASIGELATPGKNYLGCFDKIWRWEQFFHTVSADNCVSGCGSLGYAYAGVYDAGVCYCDNTYPTYPAGGCNRICYGDECGGAYRASVYEIVY